MGTDAVWRRDSLTFLSAPQRKARDYFRRYVRFVLHCSRPIATLPRYLAGTRDNHDRVPNKGWPDPAPSKLTGFFIAGFVDDARRQDITKFNVDNLSASRLSVRTQLNTISAGSI